MNKTYDELMQEVAMHQDQIAEQHQQIEALRQERDGLAAYAKRMAAAIESLLDDNSHQELPAELWDEAGDAMRSGSSVSLAAHDAEVLLKEVKAVYRKWADDSVGWDAQDIFRALHFRIEEMQRNAKDLERGES